MYYIGLDIGGTKCAAVLGKQVGDAFCIEDKIIFPTASKTPEVVLNEFCDFIGKHIETHEIAGIGISCGGPLDSRTGTIMSPPSLPLWDNINVVEFFEKKYKIKTFLKNDADACAVAEWRYGAGKGSDNMIFLTFGTGFGAGLILNGQLYSGINDNAGEIGHVRLTRSGPVGYHKAGSCEGYCSGSGIVRLAFIMSQKNAYKESYKDFLKSAGENNVSAKTIAEYARKGNRFCKAIYRKSGEMLGRTLSILVDLLNPEKIVIGGVFMRSYDLLYPHTLRVMKRECLSFSFEKVKVVPAGLGENIGDYAALSIAQGHF